MALIYLGPNVRKYGLMRNRVYEGGLPYSVLQAMKEVPEIDKLICDVSVLTDTERKIARKGTPEHRAYEIVASV